MKNELVIKGIFKHFGKNPLSCQELNEKIDTSLMYVYAKCAATGTGDNHLSSTLRLKTGLNS